MMPNRSAQIESFLANIGWAAASRQFLAGDASDRRYERLNLGGVSAVLMDAPPGTGDDPSSFVVMAQHLLSLGLSAPVIFAHDIPNGFLLLEDLGDGLFARLLRDQPKLESELYASATDVLVHLQVAAAPPNLPNLTAEEWAKAASFAPDWYRAAITGERGDTAVFRDALTSAMVNYADGPRVLILRDFHAENLLWLPDRPGLAKTGILDFQLGQLGQPGYDLVSLLQDARRDVAAETEAEMMLRFAKATGQDLDEFRLSYAVLGAQRALRILGIFARLCLVAGKAGYVDLIPRVWGHLQRNLQNPVLKDIRQICADLLPPPTAETLKKIKDQCGQSPFP